MEVFKNVEEEIEREEVERGLLKDGKKKPGDDVVVTTLGTGSALPSKYRNGKSSISPRQVMFLFLYVNLMVDVNVICYL